MNKFMSKKRNRLAIASLLAGLTLALVACGGGGGGGTTTPTTVTKNIVCPNGTQKSGTGTTDQAALDAATAQCALGTVVSVTPADKSLVSPPTVIATSTDSLLDLSSVTAANVSLKAGTVSIPGTVAVDATTKGFSFTPTTKLLFSQAYSFVASVKDSLGRAISVSTGFTTSAVQCNAPQVPAADGQSCVTPVVSACTAPAVWTSGVNACVYPIGYKVVGLNQIPKEALYFSDTAWKQSVASGLVKFVDTGMVFTGQTTRKPIFALYKSNLSGLSCSTIVYQDDGSNAVDPSNLTQGFGCNTDESTWAVGTQKGIIRYFPGKNECYEKSYDSVAVFIPDTKVPCPN